MNARQAVNENQVMINQLFQASQRVAKVRNIDIAEAIDYSVKVRVDYAKTDSEKHAWEIRGEEAKKMI